MELKYYISRPPTFGKIVNDYLKVLREGHQYSAWTLNDKMEVVECKGLVENNCSWNYHNNYDDSENELYVIIENEKIKQWFSLNKEDVVNIQQENVSKWKLILEQELSRIQEITSH